MESVYGSGVTIDTTDKNDAIIRPGAPLGTPASDPTGDFWLKVNGGPGGLDNFKITFNDAPITSVAFDWAALDNHIIAEYSVDGVNFTQFMEKIDQNQDGTASSGTFATFVFPTPVSTLYFHDHDSGWIGIDNLVVEPAPVPVPAAAVLGMLGLSVAGIKLRRKG